MNFFVVALVLLPISLFTVVLAILVFRNETKVVPLLWEIEGSPSSFLLASMHHGVCKHEIHDAVWEKLRDCKVLVLENLFNDLVIPKTKISLNEVLGQNYWEKVQKILGSVIAEEIRYDELYILAAVLICKLYPYGEGIENALETKASKDKQMQGLESPDVIINILREFYGIEEVKYLLDNDFKEHINCLVKQYKTGDLEGLSESYENLTEKTKQMLLIQRNRNWIPQIESHLQEGNAFIVVGALHLVGKESVIALLQEKGYKINQLKCT